MKRKRNFSIKRSQCRGELAKMPRSILKTFQRVRSSTSLGVSTCWPKKRKNKICIFISEKQWLISLMFFNVWQSELGAHLSSTWSINNHRLSLLKPNYDYFSKEHGEKKFEPGTLWLQVLCSTTRLEVVMLKTQIVLIQPYDSWIFCIK